MRDLICAGVVQNAFGWPGQAEGQLNYRHVAAAPFAGPNAPGQESHGEQPLLALAHPGKTAAGHQRCNRNP